MYQIFKNHKNNHLFFSDSSVAPDESVPTLYQISTDKAGSCEHPGQEKQDGGLVSVLHAWPECGQYDL